MRLLGADSNRVRRAGRFVLISGALLGFVESPGMCKTPGHAQPSSNQRTARLSKSDSFLDSPLAEFWLYSDHEFQGLCSTLRRPCAIETVSEPSANIVSKNPIQFLRDTSPRKILDAIIRRYPGHHWLIRDGILAMEPNKRIGEDLLARKLGYVSIHKRESEYAAKSVLRQARIDPAPIMMDMMGQAFNRIDLELRNVTVRQALDAIAKTDGQVMWEFSPITNTSSKPGCNAIGYFFLRSWGPHNTVIADHEDRFGRCPMMKRWLARTVLKHRFLQFDFWSRLDMSCTYPEEPGCPRVP